MHTLNETTLNRLRAGRNEIARKHHADFVVRDGDGGDGDLQTGEYAGILWAQTSARFSELAALAKVRAALSDHQWAAGFVGQENGNIDTCEKAKVWFCSLIWPDHDLTNEDTLEGVDNFWHESYLPALEVHLPVPRFVQGFADGALAVYHAALPLL